MIWRRGAFLRSKTNTPSGADVYANSVFKTQWSFSTFFHTMLCKITLCTSLSYALMVLASNILETSTSPPTMYLKIYKVFCSRCALVFDVCVTFESPAIPHLCQNTKKSQVGARARWSCDTRSSLKQNVLFPHLWDSM